MGSFARVTGGAAAAMLAGGMPVTASPAQATARIVRVPCGSAALASAIIAANTPAGGVLQLAPRCVYTITTPANAATALPVITGAVTLVGGPGTMIRRDPAATTRFRILDVAAGGSLRVTGIVILNGNTAGLGGGVQNAGRLLLNRTTLSGNTAGNGGAVANLPGATATIASSLLSANTTTGVGGGGVLNSGVLTVFASTLVLNTAPINGGGVNTQASGTTQLIRTAVERNASGSLGGGLSNLGTTTLDRSVTRFNRGSAGGGIATANPNVMLSRSVVRNNIPADCSPAKTIAGCVD